MFVKSCQKHTHTNIFLPQKIREISSKNVVKSSFCERQEEGKSSTIDEKNSICTKDFWERSKSFFFLKFSSIVCFWLSLQMLSLTSVKYELKWYYRCIRRSLFMATAFKMFVSHFSCRYSWKKSQKNLTSIDEGRRCWRNIKRKSYARIFMYSSCCWAWGIQNKLIMKMRRGLWAQTPFSLTL